MTPVVSGLSVSTDRIASVPSTALKSPAGSSVTGFNPNQLGYWNVTRIFLTPGKSTAVKVKVSDFAPAAST